MTTPFWSESRLSADSVEFSVLSLAGAAFLFAARDFIGLTRPHRKLKQARPQSSRRLPAKRLYVHPFALQNKSV